MRKCLIDVNENFALYQITETLVVDEGGCYETSYPYDEMISVEELFNHKFRVTYHYKEPILSTVEVEPVKHGKWIAKKIDGTSTLFICSNCQREVEVTNDYFGKPTEHMAAIYPYCHCGSKMDIK